MSGFDIDRTLSEPFDIGSTYSSGFTVLYNGGFWRVNHDNDGNLMYSINEKPDADHLLWMKIDEKYLVELHTFFKENQNKRFNVEDLTDHPQKLINHIKFYIDLRYLISDYIDVSFNNEYTKLKIHERQDD